MATITEDYISFETAKLLKEKGFNEPCYACYLDKELSHYDYTFTNFELVDIAISAPTLQMAMKWLREVHQLCILPTLSSECRHTYAIYRLHSNYPIELRLSEEFGESYNKQEPACEAAIKYCLENLI